MLPTMGVEIVCLSFSVELYIKDVHYAVNGKAPRDHDILKLFEELPEQMQRDIFAHHAITEYGWSFVEFKREIEAISDGFQKWRYSHEVTSLRYNTYFALVFVEALKSAAGGVRKHLTIRNN
jgi:HEPN domain-containing protein